MGERLIRQKNGLFAVFSDVVDDLTIYDGDNEAQARLDAARTILENPDCPQEPKMIVGKFFLPLEDYPTITMPAGAKLLHVAEQAGDLCLWALIDLKAPSAKRLLRIAGTGHPITESEASWPFVGTSILFGGSLVYHVFDGGEVEYLENHQ